MSEGAYARSGVDTGRAGSAIAGLVEVLGSIDTGRESRAVLGSGHYASVLRLDERVGIAISTDGVGSKVIVAEQVGRFDTIGIDCVAMNVNDLICVGADPIALVDYIAVEQTDPAMLRAIAEGLKRGAEEAQVEIPGGELAMLPELIRGHPSPTGFDLVGACFGIVALDAIVTGERIEPGDAIIGLPSSGVHSNGLTLARRVLPDLDERPEQLGGRSVAEELLEPTVIYVRAIKELLASDVDVRGLAHITGDGLQNLLRLEANVGYRIDSPLPVPPVFALIAERGGIDDEEMHAVFNMGCGFCVIVPAEERERAVELLSRQHPGATPIGEVTSDEGGVELPEDGGQGSTSTAPVGADDLTIVRWLYEAFTEDAEGALRLYDPDIVWEPQGFGLPMVGMDERYEGLAGIRAFWRHYLDAWENLAFELEDLRAGSSAVFAHVRMILKGRESGLDVDQHHFAVWWLHEGRVVRMKVFSLPEREQALRAAGLDD